MATRTSSRANPSSASSFMGSASSAIRTSRTFPWEGPRTRSGRRGSSAGAIRRQAEIARRGCHPRGPDAAVVLPAAFRRAVVRHRLRKSLPRCRRSDARIWRGTLASALLVLALRTTTQHRASGLLSPYGVRCGSADHGGYAPDPHLGRRAVTSTHRGSLARRLFLVLAVMFLALVAVAGARVATFNATINALEEFRAETVGQSERIAEVRSPPGRGRRRG